LSRRGGPHGLEKKSGWLEPCVGMHKRPTNKKFNNHMCISIDLLALLCIMKLKLDVRLKESLLKTKKE
jgi:hypothetical protein